MTNCTTITASGQTDSTSRQTSTTSGKRVLQVGKWVLRVGEEYYEWPGNEYYLRYLPVHLDYVMC